MAPTVMETSQRRALMLVHIGMRRRPATGIVGRIDVW
jgi:hypothetical protein